jgi:hypothetical protein
MPSPRLDVGAAITDEETAPTPAMMAAADTEIASRRRYVALTVRNVELTRALSKVSDLLGKLSRPAEPHMAELPMAELSAYLAA